MGGKNHQPCRVYLVNSTRMSKYLSLAYAHLEMGNAELEDVILSELQGGKGSLDAFLNHLRISLEEVTAFQKAKENLRAQMESSYNDLPTSNLELEAIGHELESQEMVNGGEWNTIVAHMQSAGGFYSVLEWFGCCFANIYTITEQLIDEVEALHDVASRGELNLVLEENRPGNIRVTFAKLYTAWAKCNQSFLSSSLLSTELWYAFNGFGSLNMDRSLGVEVA